KERRESRRSSLLHKEHLIDERLDAPDPCRDRDADPVSIGAAAFETRIPKRLGCSGNGVLREPVGAPDLFPIHVLRRVEALDLAGDLRLVRRWIEARDPADSAPPVDERVPRPGHIEAEGWHGPEASDELVPGQRVA